MCAPGGFATYIHIYIYIYIYFLSHTAERLQAHVQMCFVSWRLQVIVADGSMTVKSMLHLPMGQPRATNVAGSAPRFHANYTRTSINLGLIHSQAIAHLYVVMLAVSKNSLTLSPYGSLTTDFTLLACTWLSPKANHSLHML